VNTIAVVHYVGATQKSRSVVASVVSDFRQQGHEVIVVDIEKFGAVSQNFPPEWAVRLVGHKTYRSRFSKVVKSLGGSLHVLENNGGSVVSPPESRQSECLQAIDSELLTYFRQEALDEDSPHVKWMRKRVTDGAFSCYAAFALWLTDNSPDLVVIPNGRTSRQKMCRVAAEELEIPVMLYENGRAKKDSYYLGMTQPHDRVASQAEVETLTSHLSKVEIRELAQRWLAERQNPQSTTNSFSAGWVAEDSLEQSTHQPRAVFFSSSADEFLAFGPMWNIDQWSTQFQAFDLVMERLSAEGIELVLRIHPNLAGKSRRYFRSTVTEVKALENKYPGLIVYWHNSQVNSYGLAQSADYVVAERSTIALEANLMGKPVWITQAAQWDLMADVRQLLHPSDVDVDDLKPWSVDTSGAEKFVAYWMLQEHPLHYNWKDWSTWNTESAPLLIKLASLLGRNPLRHKKHLIKLEWDLWRNNHFPD